MKCQEKPKFSGQALIYKLKPVPKHHLCIMGCNYKIDEIIDRANRLKHSIPFPKSHTNSSSV